VQAPDAILIGSADGPGEENVERGQFRGVVGRRKEIVRRECSRVQGAVVGGEPAQRFGVLGGLSASHDERQTR
jgi:hypothetical protein